MIIFTLLVIDLIMLTVVIAAYVYNTSRERKYLRQEASQSLILQQKVYQAQVLKEINDRIGYSLDVNKIVEIIINSLGNLLDYDTASYMVFSENGEAIFKCHVENTVTHNFIEEVKEKMFLSYGAIVDRDIKPSRIDESITGNILDDNLGTSVQSFFNLPVVIAGKVIGIINVASGVSGRYGEKQAAILYTIINQAATAVTKLQSLLDSEKGKLSGIIYSLTDGVITLDLNHQLLVYNPAVKSILGITTDQPLSIFDIVDSLAGKVDLRIKVEQAIAENHAIGIPEVYIKDKALELTITPVKDTGGEIIGVSVVFHDVTTEKSLEKLRQEFTAMMVHELRAPLTAVRWSSEALLKSVEAVQGPEQAKVKDTALTIESASNNMLELVNDLLDVAKIEAGKFELNVQDYDLVEITKDQLKFFQPQADVKHLALNLTAPDHIRLKCDRVRIAQVLSNLLSNAIKYTDAGQIEINVTEDAEKKMATVAIKDSGIGVAREDVAQLFSKFKQLKSGDRSRKGTGLGLVVSKGIVDAHGGKIWVESAGESMGSTFSFSLPLGG